MCKYKWRGKRKFVTDLFVLPSDNTIYNETRAQPPELGGLCFVLVLTH